MDYEISADKTRLDVPAVHRWLAEESYWAKGRPREVQVSFDPHRLAALGITPQRLAQTVTAAQDVSAGFANVGRR